MLSHSLRAVFDNLSEITIKMVTTIFTIRNKTVMKNEVLFKIKLFKILIKVFSLLLLLKFSLRLLIGIFFTLIEKYSMNSSSRTVFLSS